MNCDKIITENIELMKKKKIFLKMVKVSDLENNPKINHSYRINHGSIIDSPFFLLFYWFCTFQKSYYASISLSSYLKSKL